MSDLKEKIKAALAAGGHPFAVCATSGSTVLGAFDDLWALADVCEEFSLWFHVDVSACSVIVRLKVSFGVFFKL